MRAVCVYVCMYEDSAVEVQLGRKCAWFVVKTASDILRRVYPFLTNSVDYVTILIIDFKEFCNGM